MLEGSTFVRAAGKEGDTIKLRGEVLSVGKTLGFTRVELKDSQDRVVAFGRTFRSYSSSPLRSRC